MENAIFFLKFEKGLSYEYFYLSQVLNQYDLKLVPVAPHELSGLMAGEKCPVLCLIRNMEEQSQFLKLRRQFLDYAVHNNRATLFLASSFHKIHDYYRAEKGGGYYHFTLPIEMPDLGRKMAKAYESSKGVDRTWPGGRRAKLPTN